MDQWMDGSMAELYWLHWNRLIVDIIEIELDNLHWFSSIGLHGEKQNGRYFPYRWSNQNIVISFRFCLSFRSIWGTIRHTLKNIDFDLLFDLYRSLTLEVRSRSFGHQNYGTTFCYVHTKFQLPWLISYWDKATNVFLTNIDLLSKVKIETGTSWADTTNVIEVY